MSEEEKKRQKEYQKNYRETKKSQYIIIIKQIFNCDIIINEIVFNYDLMKYATQLYIIKTPYLCYLDGLAEIKA